MNKIKNIIFHVKNDFDFIELIKGSFNSFLGRVLGMAFGYIVVLFISNKYGAEELGLFSISITVLGMAVLIPKFGFDNSLIRMLSEIKIKGREDDFYSVLRRTSTISFILSIIASLLLYFSASLIAINIFKNEALVPQLKAVAFAIMPTTMLVMASGTFQALKRTFYHMLFNTALINTVFAILLVLNFYFIKEFSYTLVVYSLATYIVLAIAIYLVRRIIKEQEFLSNQHFNFSTKGILKISTPMLFSNSFALLLGWTNVILLGYFISESEVGIYDSTERLAALSNLSLIAINSIVAPKFVEAYSNNNYKNLETVTKKSTKMIFFTTIPVLIILLIFGEQLLGFFGPEFIVGYWALFFLCLSRFISSISGSVGYLLQMTGKQKIYQNVIFIAFLINLVLGVILIPKYSYIGAAISKFIAVVFWNITLVIIIKRKLGFWTFYIPFVVK